MSSGAARAGDTYPFGQPVAWQPNLRWMAESNLAAFMVRWGIPDYDTLLRRSVEEGAWFWEAVLQDLDIVFYTPYTQVMDTRDGVPFTRWCVDGQMNIVHNALDKWQATPVRDRTALRWEGEEGTEQTLTYGELHAAVGRCANALRHLGLGAGDAVGLFMPMTPELAVAFLAVIKIGGIVLPLFSGYGPGAIAARLQDAGAKALFTADGFFRRGRPVALKPVADEALAQCPTVQHVVVHRRAGLDDLPWTDGRDHAWDALVARQPAEAATVHTAAEDVLMVIYTSGTTGKPKGAVHTHCGFPVKAAQDLRQAMDLKPGEVLYWMTDMGWMMGPWLVFGALLNGATMVFTDGAPDYPTPARLWQVVERHGVTHLGVSPVLIRSLMTHGTAPLAGRDFSRLRAVGSTGSPWDPDGWQWLFQHVLEGRKPILNYSGGTEISGGILCGNFFKPLKPGAFSGPVPGMDADVVDEHGQPVRNAVGELVIRKPWIGMTRGFWHDHQRYLDAYWSRFEGLWLHGDFAAIDEDGLWYLLGRSDDTIKVAGKRVGPSEVEALLNAHPAVLDSAAIGVPHPVKDEEIAAFVILKPGHQPEEPLRQALMALVTDELGKALKPQFVKFVIALPKTRNAKVMRRVIRAAWLDLDPGDISSLEDPTTIEAIRQAR